MISVIVPYKDAETTIGRCCESLHKQEGDFEFIMVDDWRTDGGHEIVENYAAMDVRFISISNNFFPGVSGARNRGIESARGDWITFLDADDLLADDAHRILTSGIRDGSNVVQFNHWRHYSKTGRTVIPNKHRNVAGIYDLQNLPKCWCFVWNKLYRADFLKDIRFVDGLQYGEDELFVLECLAKENKIVHKDGAFMVHTFDAPDRLSRKKTASDLLDQVHGLEEFIAQHDDPLVRTAACKVLSEHWGSPTFLKIIGLTE